MKKYLYTISIIIILISASQVLISFAKDFFPVTHLKQEIPEGFPKPVYTFQNNPLTKEGFELGRKLFYDGRLSKDGNFPCASCHQQFSAFANFEHNLSHGYNNSFTTRNAPGLFNLAWQKAFHHDGGINHIEVQPLAPITAPNEMAETMNNIIEKLKQDPDYRRMFKAAFNDDKITSQHILKALAQFTMSLVSANSKYDRMKKGKAVFTAYEQRGYEMFKVKCASCHPEPMFTDYSYRNIGLPVDTFLNDYGRMRITGLQSDSLKFKVPSLRNVGVTFPYMHDGRFYTMQQCLHHYSEGIQQGPTLDSLLKNGIPFTKPQIIDMVAFLRTLTDSTFLKNPRYAEPPMKNPAPVAPNAGKVHS
jgi:cytochrome c peroxidase